MTTIPASQLVSVQPSVLAAGGEALDVIGLFLTTNSRVPIGSVVSFPTALSVSNYFGGSSTEAMDAGIYFGGYNGATKLPAALLFAQFPTTPVGAYLRGGNISNITLATLQSYIGLLALTINGTLQSANINLSAATSFSNGASIIGNSLGIQGPQAAQITGSIGGTTLNVASIVNGGVVSAGQVVSGTAGVTAGTYIVGQLSGTTGGIGTYQVSASQTVGTQTLTLFQPGVSYDSQSGGFIIVSPTTGNSSSITYGSGALATNLLLTLVTGAVLSQGTVGNTLTSIAAFMNGIVAITTNWVTFKNLFDPDTVLATGSNTAKQAFAAWKNTQDNRYAYICSDMDASPTVSVPALSSLGQILANNGDSGTFVIYEIPGEHLTAFVCGAAASINFDQTDGRITFAYKWQNGLTAGVTSATVAQDLIANGYNFGGAYGAANQNFVWLQNGQVTGPFAWLDSYINQIWLNNAFQLALLELLQSAPSIPYDPAGQGLIEQALADPIMAGLNFGAFAPGSISSSQAAQINGAAGAQVSDSLQAQGYYLQVLPATSAVRAARGSPPINFWYLDRGSIQLISMASIAVQ
jgi:Protein of unknown function (DUF3383)